MFTLRTALLSLALGAALGLPAQAQSVAAVDARIDAALNDHAGFADAFKLLQSEIGNGARIAEGHEYPVTITVDGRDMIFETMGDLVGAYDQIVTPAIVAAVKKQKYEELQVNSPGLMFGSGALWVNAYCVDGEVCDGVSWEISAINHK
jgi:hypothetical protein